MFWLILEKMKKTKHKYPNSPTTFDDNDDDEDRCFCNSFLCLNPWLKLKSLWRKWFKTNTNDKLDAIKNDHQEEGGFDLNEPPPVMMMINHQCEECHRKSLVSMYSMHKRCSSLSQLSAPCFTPFFPPSSLNRLVPPKMIPRSTPNSPGCLDETKLTSGTAPIVARLSTGSAYVGNDRGNSGFMVRSPSNYCRVSTCEKLHIHDLTPKCLETFAPSSTCSSCQHCDRTHIGPNHDQLMMVKSLLKELPFNLKPAKANTNGCSNETRSKSATAGAGNSLLMQWPLPEYRPQHSPDHLYRTFAF